MRKTNKSFSYSSIIMLNFNYFFSLPPSFSPAVHEFNKLFAIFFSSTHCCYIFLCTHKHIASKLFRTVVVFMLLILSFPFHITRRTRTHIVDCFMFKKIKAASERDRHVMFVRFLLFTTA